MMITTPKKYRYRPPIKYLISGLCLAGVSPIFGLMVFEEESWGIRLLLLFLFFLMFGVGGMLVLLFFSKNKKGPLILGTDYLEFASRWKSKKRIYFEDIQEIKEFDTFDHCLSIKTKKGVFLIEKKWMKVKDFDALRIYILKKTVG